MTWMIPAFHQIAFQASRQWAKKEDCKPSRGHPCSSSPGVRWSKRLNSCHSPRQRSFSEESSHMIRHSLQSPPGKLICWGSPLEKQFWISHFIRSCNNVHLLTFAFAPFALLSSCHVRPFGDMLHYSLREQKDLWNNLQQLSFTFSHLRRRYI